MNNAPSKPASLAERLRSVRVGVRNDLEVSRHVFRGEPAYVVRDPITFQSHRFGVEDYQVLVSIDPSRTLGEIFADLAEKSGLDASDEERFYQFVFSLHRLGFLNLPISDDKLLYKRYQARQKAKTRQRLMGFLFIQIPLVNPNAFLGRTLPYVRWAYTRWFFVLWLLLVGSAAYVAASNWGELVQPIHGLLASRNLLVMWLTLIGLKVIHEFGHAYACKRFGGHVPEMGAYLIAFTPCAYVDATAAWGFARKSERLIVSLGGVYFEMTIAALAVFVWAGTSESVLNSIAFNVIFLASTVTVLFNINPLMRYDGYYIASDLVEVPNLRARSTQYVKSVAKHWLLGVPMTRRPESRKLRAILLSFGICATIYRTLVLVGIATMVALKFPVIGIGFACFFIGTTVVTLVRKLAGYLWFAEETAPARLRAVALSVVVFVVLPVVVGFVPLPSRVQAAGALTAEKETLVRAEVPGFVQTVAFQHGQMAEPGQLLVELSDPSLGEKVAEAQAELDACEIRRRAYEFSDPATAREEAARAASSRAELDHYIERRNELAIRAPAPGRVVNGVRPAETGRYVHAGEAVASLISGCWEVRAVLTAEQCAAAQPAVGERVEFRIAGDDDTFTGTIRSVSPAGSRRVDLPSLTQVGGGDVIVEPATGQATQPYFELRIALDAVNNVNLRQGLTGVVRLRARPEPLATRLYRNVVRFANKLLKS